MLDRGVANRNHHRVDHGVVDGLGAGDRDEGAFGLVRLSLLGLASAEEVVGVDGRRRQSPGAAHSEPCLGLQVLPVSER